MTPLKPYLIRSIYQWITDNYLTPHLLVDAEHEETVVPSQFVENGKIILNIRPEAVVGLDLGNETIAFNTRFGGRATNITIPVKAVLAIYAKENGKGMVFDPENESMHDEAPSTPDKKPPGKPNLRIIK